MVEGQIVTQKILWEEVPFREASRERGFLPQMAFIRKIAVIERHKNTGKTGVGIVKGFRITGGAIASSVSHDSRQSDCDRRQ